MDRLSKLALKGDRLNSSVDERKAEIDSLALRHVLGDSATLLDRIDGTAR
jgi:hypothetical protein